MFSRIHETPMRRATLAGWIVACLAFFGHMALRDHTPPDPSYPEPSTALALLALTGVACAAGVLAHAYHNSLQPRGTQATAGGWGWALLLGALVPVAHTNGLPVPAIMAALWAATEAAWWTFGFALLAMFATTALAQHPSVHLRATFGGMERPLAYAAVAWGAIGVTILLAFPFLPPLIPL